MIEARRLDPWLVAPAAMLCGLGLWMVYSSSAVLGAQRYGDAEYFLKAQLVRGVIGVTLAAVVLRLPLDLWQRRAGWLFLGASLLCALVFVPGVGHESGGAHRWLRVLGVTLQPSELAKLASVVFLAALLSQADKARLVSAVLWAQLPVLAVLAEPDLGTAVVMEAVVLSLVFVAGVRLRILALLALATLPVLYHYIVGTPFRMRRILGFLDPWAHRQGAGYQVTESLMSIGSGGLFGLGLGESKKKLFFLPEAHTDFIFSILAEELGLAGVLVVLLCFGALVWRVFYWARHAGSPFSSFLCLGIGVLLGVSTVWNLGCATGLLPTKGLALPMLSYGGSSLVMMLVCLALVQRTASDGLRR